MLQFYKQALWAAFLSKTSLYLALVVFTPLTGLELVEAWERFVEKLAVGSAVLLQGLRRFCLVVPRIGVLERSLQTASELVGVGVWPSSYITLCSVSSPYCAVPPAKGF